MMHKSIVGLTAFIVLGFAAGRAQTSRKPAGTPSPRVNTPQTSCPTNPSPAGVHDSFGVANQNNLGMVSFCIPVGSIFVIEYITIYITVNAPQASAPHAQIAFIHGGVSGVHDFILTPAVVPATRTDSRFIFSGPVSIGVDPNSDVQLYQDIYTGAASQVSFSVSGHYENAAGQPQAPSSPPSPPTSLNATPISLRNVEGSSMRPVSYHEAGPSAVFPKRMLVLTICEIAAETDDSLAQEAWRGSTLVPSAHEFGMSDGWKCSPLLGSHVFCSCVTDDRALQGYA
jgi:hypothetical protein